MKCILLLFRLNPIYRNRDNKNTLKPSKVLVFLLLGICVTQIVDFEYLIIDVLWSGQLNPNVIEKIAFSTSKK